MSESIVFSLNVICVIFRFDLVILIMIGILDVRLKVGYFYLGVSEINLIGKSVKEKIVEDIMSMFVLVKKDESIYDVIVIMFLFDVGSIVIIDENEELCGVVFRKDLLKVIIGGFDINKMLIGMIMIRILNVVILIKGVSVLLVLRKIIEYEVDLILIVEYKGEDKNYMRVVGRILKINIIKLFLEIVDN